MKFTELSTKFNKLLKKQEKGKKLKPKKLEKLQELLEAKKLSFEEKLKADISNEKRTAVQSKLNVVKAQIAKAKELN